MRTGRFAITFWTVLTAAVQLPYAGAYPADGGPAGTISVLVFDYSGIPADVLEPAMREAGRIMKSGSIQLEWVNCPVAPEALRLDKSCGREPGPLTVVLQILPGSASMRHTGPSTFGFAAAADDGSFGVYACVFRDRIERLKAPIGKAAALGHVIAHELGHLLLGPGYHSAAGIMKADWRRDHLALAAQGRLRFAEAEQRRMLENIQHRTVAAHAASRGQVSTNEAIP